MKSVEEMVRVGERESGGSRGEITDRVKVQRDLQFFFPFYAMAPFCLRACVLSPNGVLRINSVKTSKVTKIPSESDARFVLLVHDIARQAHYVHKARPSLPT